MTKHGHFWGHACGRGHCFVEGVLYFPNMMGPLMLGVVGRGCRTESILDVSYLCLDFAIGLAFVGEAGDLFNKHILTELVEFPLDETFFIVMTHGVWNAIFLDVVLKGSQDVWGRSGLDGVQTDMVCGKVHKDKEVIVAFVGRKVRGNVNARDRPRCVGVSSHVKLVWLRGGVHVELTW